MGLGFGCNSLSCDRLTLARSRMDLRNRDPEMGLTSPSYNGLSSQQGTTDTAENTPAP